MSHGPRGLGGGTLGPVWACCAIVEVAPTRVSTSESISARMILVFILILSTLENWLAIPKRQNLASVFAAQFLRTICPRYVYHLILISLHLHLIRLFRAMH